MKEEEKEMVRSLSRNSYKVLKVVAWTVVYGLVVGFLIMLNPETLMENWGIGLIGMTIFSILYIIPIDRFIFRFKKLYMFFILFFLAWLIADWTDFMSIIF